MLTTAIDVGILVTLWAAVASHALASRPSAALAAARRPALIARVAALNLVVIPLVTAAATRVVGVDDTNTIGMVLLGAASAGVIGIAIVGLGGGDVALALALVVILELANVIAIPFWGTLLLPRSVEVPIGDVLWVLTQYVLLPVAICVVIQARAPSMAARLARPAGLISMTALVVVVVLVVIRSGPLFGPAIASGVPVATGLTLAAALGSGWLAAGDRRETRTAVALVTAQRSSALAFAVAARSFADIPGAAVAIVVAGLITLATTIGTAAWLRHQRRQTGRMPWTSAPSDAPR